MAKDQKSPQEKKELEYTRNHFTFGWNSSRSFPETWSRKKARVNRQYRRKSEEILAAAKPGIAAEDVDSLADDLTAARFQKSVSRKRLHKIGTVTVGEKVKQKLERRAEAVGRWVGSHEEHEAAVTSAVTVLSALHGDKLVDVARRADLICNSRNADEIKRVALSKDPVDRALHILYRLSNGSAHEANALRRNPELDRALTVWIAKANRILERDKRVVERGLAQKQAARRKLKELSSDQHKA